MKSVSLKQQSSRHQFPKRTLQISFPSIKNSASQINKESFKLQETRRTKQYINTVLNSYSSRNYLDDLNQHISVLKYKRFSSIDP